LQIITFFRKPETLENLALCELRQIMDFGPNTAAAAKIALMLPSTLRTYITNTAKHGSVNSLPAKHRLFGTASLVLSVHLDFVVVRKIPMSENWLSLNLVTLSIYPKHNALTFYCCLRISRYKKYVFCVGSQSPDNFH
jgi:hypothetical protein